MHANRQESIRVVVQNVWGRYASLRCDDHGPTLDVRDCGRLFDEPRDGVWASDHFGVVADLTAR
jgi:hypothetical protein